MGEMMPSPFAAWESFYVIIGSSAAALTGLQFVIMALIAETRIASSSREINAFGTPNVVHFCSALLVSALLSAPWHTLTGARVSLALLGLSGVIYSFIVARRARRTGGYVPVLEDWVWHVILPFVAYAALTVAAITLSRDLTTTLFVVGAMATLLVFIGIHNAWDTVIFITTEHLPAQRKGKKP
jgi:hypothetical protein